MKLRSLKIGRFKNLRDFEITFNQRPESLATVLLGQNGSGKSNLLEALILIFRDLDLGKISDFRYVLRYECRGREIEVDADPGRGQSWSQQVRITARERDGRIQKLARKQFSENAERPYLPSYVFGYYSGPSNRMEKHFDEHQKRFYDALMKDKENPARPLLYARPVHSQFALLSFFTETEEEGGESSMRAFLSELLGIEALISVMFVLREPTWNWKTKKSGDARFWHTGGAAGKLAGHLYELAQAPLRLKRRITPEFGNSTDLEHVYLYLEKPEKLKKLAAYYTDYRGKYSPQEFFKALESTYISKILSEVRITLQRHNTDGALTFRDLSEGEQQLLMVLGLLRFTKEDEALFLLDEPDTHLNPAWSVRYLEFMRQVVGAQPTSHVIMTTHNPLVVAGMKQEDVRIMQQRGTRIVAEPPRDDPQGMGVSNILTSEMFGLRTTLDWPTQKKLDRQRALIVKERRTDQEQQELQSLMNELDALGFNIGEDDEIYAAFLQKWFEKEDPAVRDQITLTPEQQEERKRMIEEIVQELVAEGHWR